MKTIGGAVLYSSLCPPPQIVVYELLRTYIVVVYQELALDFILDNMEGVKDTPGFLELKQEPDLLMEIIFRQAS